MRPTGQMFAGVRWFEAEIDRMSKALRLFGTLLAVCLLVPASGWAKGQDSFDLRYAMYLGGFHVADARLVYDADPKAYRSELRVETVGLAEALARYRGRAWNEGKRAGPDGLRPRTYGFAQSTRRASRTADVTFDPKTGSAIDATSTKRGKPDRIEVPPKLWPGAIDPLSAFLRLRQALAEPRGEGETLSARVFDGRRLYDVELEVLGREESRIDGREVPVLRTELSIDPIAGFDDGDDEAFRMLALLSDDDALVPLQVRTLDTAIIATFLLEQECPKQGACRPVADAGS